MALVALSLRREPPEAYEVTPISPSEVGGSLAGPRQVTVDATDEWRWVFFDFSRGAVIDRPGPLDWDIAFRRFDVMVNGGAGFAGEGAAADLGETAFDRVATVPSNGWVTTRVARDSTNRAIDRWYDYGFTSHLLTPRPRIYAIRTADGRYAKLRFVSYYCPGARPGCMTFEYVYQGDGSRSVPGGSRLSQPGISDP
ncbi:MAG TPA: HmuY family protein [Longimicrobiales bacterium]|nr:HmuY family protein [Longimicrobiales bacterium]